MANFPESQHDPNQQPGDDGGPDLSAFDTEDPLAQVPVGGDAEAVKKINRRTSTFGRVVTALVAVAVVVMVVLGFRQYQRSEREAELLAQLKKIEDTGEYLAELRGAYGDVNKPEHKRLMIEQFGHFRDTEAVPLLVKALDEGGPIRRAAALGLARIGLPDADAARGKLLEVLKDTDDVDRPAVVWALAVVGEERAADAIVAQFANGRLQGLEKGSRPEVSFDPKVIVDVLGPQRLASDELMSHEKESVRRLTAHALAESGSADAVGPLTKLIEAELDRPAADRSREVIRAAAAGLGRIGSPKAAGPLFDVLRNQANLRQEVLDALGKSTGAPGLATLIEEASDESLRRDLVRLLADTHDPRSADPLASLLRSDDIDVRETAAIALAELRDERAAPALLELARAEDESTADKALGSIDKVASPAITRGLLALLDDMEYRRATILRALGATGDPSAAKEITKHLDSDDVNAAAEALARLDDDAAFNKLLDMAKRPRDTDMGARNAAERSLTNEKVLRKRKGAIRGLGIFERPEAFDVLRDIVEDDVEEDYELRALAGRSIGRLATPDQLREVIGRIKDDSLDERSRRYYVQSLWQKAHPELAEDMLGLMADGQVPIPVRRAAALAVGYTGDSSNDARLAEMLEDEDARRHAAFAISLGADEPTSKKLLEVLTEDDATQEILQNALLSDRNDWFNLLTEQMFENGQIYRRLGSSHLLREGNKKTSFSYAWTKTISVLDSGWGGPGGASANFVRQSLYDMLTDEEATKQQRGLAARALASTGERGLLLRARDEGSSGATIARDVLRGGN